MFKKLCMAAFCLTFGIFFTSQLYSQEDTGIIDDKLDEGKKTEAAAPDTAVAAKTYSDGLNTYVSSRVKFKLSSKDNVEIEKIQYRIDKGEPALYKGPFSIESEGKHTISYYGIDRIGNTERVRLFEVIVDNTSPDTMLILSSSVLKANDKFFIPSNTSFTLAAKDASSGVSSLEYSINNGEYQSYSSAVSLPAENAVVLKLKASDNVNNINESFSLAFFNASGKKEVFSGSSVTLAVDSVVPAVAIKPVKDFIQSGEKNITSSDNSYTLTATDNESGIASVLYRVDGLGEFVPYLNDITLKSNGEHTIEAKAIDMVGNVSEVATLKVFVDMVPPETTIETE